MAELIGELRDGGNTIVTTLEDVESFREQLIDEAQAEAAAKAVGVRIQAFYDAPELRGRWLPAVKLMLASPGMSNADIIAFVAANLPPDDAGGHYAAPGDHHISAGWKTAVAKHNQTNRLLAVPASGAREHGADDGHDELDGWGAAVKNHNKGRQH